jgi:hypothetical protein
MKRCAAAVLSLLVLSGPALAQRDERLQPGGTPGGLFQGTAEERAACQPDATKFCLDDMPDNMRVLACLQRHRTKLRKACVRVLEAHGQ